MGGQGDSHRHLGVDHVPRRPLALPYAEGGAVQRQLPIHPGRITGDDQGEGQDHRMADAADRQIADSLVAAAAQILECVGDKGRPGKLAGGEPVVGGQGLIPIGVAGGGGGDIDGHRDLGAGQILRVKGDLSVPAAEDAVESLAAHLAGEPQLGASVHGPARDRRGESRRRQAKDQKRGEGAGEQAAGGHWAVSLGMRRGRNGIIRATTSSLLMSWCFRAPATCSTTNP